MYYTFVASTCTVRTVPVQVYSAWLHGCMAAWLDGWLHGCIVLALKNDVVRRICCICRYTRIYRYMHVRTHNITIPSTSTVQVPSTGSSTCTSTMYRTGKLRRTVLIDEYEI